MTPWNVRTSCSVIAARCRRARRLLTIAGRIALLRRKPDWSSARSRWANRFCISSLVAGRVEWSDMRSAGVIVARGDPLIGHQQHGLGDVEGGELRVERDGECGVGLHHVVVGEAGALRPEQDADLVALGRPAAYLGSGAARRDDALDRARGCAPWSPPRVRGRPPPPRPRCRTPGPCPARCRRRTPRAGPWGSASRRAGRPGAGSTGRNSAWRAPPCRYSRQAAGAPG